MNIAMLLCGVLFWLSLSILNFVCSSCSDLKSSMAMASEIFTSLLSVLSITYVSTLRTRTSCQHQAVAVVAAVVWRNWTEMPVWKARTDDFLEVSLSQERRAAAARVATWWPIQMCSCQRTWVPINLCWATQVLALVATLLHCQAGISYLFASSKCLQVHLCSFLLLPSWTPASTWTRLCLPRLFFPVKILLEVVNPEMWFVTVIIIVPGVVTLCYLLSVTNNSSLYYFIQMNFMIIGKKMWKCTLLT